MATNRNDVSVQQSSAATQPSEGSGSARGQTREAALRPPVDIHEDQDGLMLQADMPGVARERLEVRVDGDTLLLEGRVQFELPSSAEALYADVRATVYRRSFILSRELDSAKINATLKDGVLSVKIPKRAELRPRRITVQGG
ncbi:MAG: Hsp20/alpha crystallin family protein [Gammaproteobacteria bacterium]|nr:Hsp20/alpha crystallin family protein [Gammaproteobacteria bacterium]MBV9621908.1 Hsp20/alpha crystallin family protein [Gammaproteobacteria bacterium]